MTYPVEEILDDLTAKLSVHGTVILEAPPGAGKSTIIPLRLNECKITGGKKIIMLEPRRLAARAVSARMSELLQEDLGETVGYRIRFDTLITARTKIEVVTEGILVRMLQNDPALEEYGLVIFDEFHERNLHADLGLALTRQARQLLRNDLKILIMSATLDGDKLGNILKAPVVRSEGRKFKVDLVYKPEEKQKSIAENMVAAILMAERSYEGDILAFLPGAPEIRKTTELLLTNGSALSVCPLFGDLSLKEQQRAIQPDPSGKRKVVLATSIAETSLTIEGIKVVVDSGYSRTNKFDPSSGLNRLITTRLTQDTADQRAGRAGRTSEGICIRVWSELEQQHLNPVRKPEIEEADLSSLLLDLANWGDINVESYEWASLPPASSINTAKELLRKLKAIDGDKITEEGKKIASLPAHPRIAHMLFASGKNAATAIDIASLIEEKDPLTANSSVNIALRIDELRKFRRKERTNAARHILERVEKTCSFWKRLLNKELSIAPVDEHGCGELLALAFPERIARKVSGSRYRLANGRSAALNEYDELTGEEWIVIANMDASKEPGKIYSAAPVDPNELLHHAEKHRIVTWDTEKDMLVSSEEVKIGPVSISSRVVVPEESEIIIAIRKKLMERGLKFLGDMEHLDQLRARISSLRIWNPDQEWPDVSEAALTEDCSWLEPYITKTTKRIHLNQLDLYSIYKNALPWELQGKLQELAPHSIEVPSGSSIRLEYFMDGRAPVLAVRLQELFGLMQTPAVNNGKQKVLIHLLSPGYKPVQVTQDLQSFWSNTYKEVRKELKIRYPKHSWPEDPFTAVAVRGAKKRF